MILYSGEWGGVCGDGWDDIDANVVCEQLGYTGVHSAETGSLFGRGCGRIWLNNVECNRWDYRLESCSRSFSSWGVSSCGHSGSAGVICGKTITSKKK